MFYSNVLQIAESNKDSLFGVFAIITIVIVIHAVCSSHLSQKRIHKAEEVAQLVREDLNTQQFTKKNNL